MLKTDTLPTEEQLRAVSTEVWLSDSKNWQEVTVWSYIPDIEYPGQAYGIVEFSENSEQSLLVNNAALIGTPWAE